MAASLVTANIAICLLGIHVILCVASTPLTSEERQPESEVSDVGKFRKEICIGQGCSLRGMFEKTSHIAAVASLSEREAASETLACQPTLAFLEFGESSKSLTSPGQNIVEGCALAPIENTAELLSSGTGQGSSLEETMSAIAVEEVNGLIHNAKDQMDVVSDGRAADLILDSLQAPEIVNARTMATEEATGLEKETAMSMSESFGSSQALELDSVLASIESDYAPESEPEPPASESDYAPESAEVFDLDHAAFHLDLDLDFDYSAVSVPELLASTVAFESKVSVERISNPKNTVLETPRGDSGRDAPNPTKKQGIDGEGDSISIRPSGSPPNKEAAVKQAISIVNGGKKPSGKKRKKSKENM